MAELVPWAVRVTPAFRDAVTAAAKRDGMQVGEWLERELTRKQSVYRLEQSKQEEAKQRVAENGIAPGSAILMRWKQLFPQVPLWDTDVEAWLKLANADTILDALDEVNQRARIRNSRALVNYANKVIQSLVTERRTSARSVAITQQLTEKEAPTDKDRERWEAVDRFVAKHGSPWPDWDGQDE